MEYIVLNSIQIESNKVTRALITYCRILGYNDDNIEDFILKHFDPDWKESDKNTFNARVNIKEDSKEHYGSFTLESSWVKSRYELQFGHWYTREEAERLIRFFKLYRVDVLTTLVDTAEDETDDDQLWGYSFAGIKGKLTMNCIHYKVQYMRENGSWNTTPKRVMFFNIGN